MGVESFAYFAMERPSVFYFLGSGNKEKNSTEPAHRSLFDIDEDCLSHRSCYSSFSSIQLFNKVV